VGARIEQAWALREGQRAETMRPNSWGPNIFAQGAIFLLARS
jgi:hypothetical protein